MKKLIACRYCADEDFWYLECHTTSGEFLRVDLYIPTEVPMEKVTEVVNTLLGMEEIDLNTYSF